jgi:hypothetical protein
VKVKRRIVQWRWHVGLHNQYLNQPESGVQEVQLEIGRGGQCNNFDARFRTRIPKRGDAAWIVSDIEMFHVITRFHRCLLGQLIPRVSHF